jgi:NADPH:quinone reductase-like Zn-dependent oxidoreductase
LHHSLKYLSSQHFSSFPPQFPFKHNIIPPSNKAGFLIAKGTPLKIRPSTYTPPGENQIIVKNGAIAINPYDFAIQTAPNLLVSWITLPFILGTDVAGSVVEVGPGVTRFQPGDRVVGLAAGLIKASNRSSECGFQEYTVLRTNLTSSIPASLSYESACVLPLGLSTAACALFQKDYLALPFPSLSPTSSGKTVLIWGGSTSVGCNAIQLAVSAGYEVISTSSPKNHLYLKQLGASECYDYNSPHVVRDIVSAFKNRSCAGAVSIGQGSLGKCIDILGAVKGGKKFISQVSIDIPPDAMPKSALGIPPFVLQFAYKTIAGNIKARRNGVTAKFVNGGDLLGNEVGRAIYVDFLPGALKEGRFVPAPEPQVVGRGLECVQEAVDMSVKGVSARKMVVSL